MLQIKGHQLLGLPSLLFQASFTSGNACEQLSTPLTIYTLTKVKSLQELEIHCSPSFVSPYLRRWLHPTRIRRLPLRQSEHLHCKHLPHLRCSVSSHSSLLFPSSVSLTNIPTPVRSTNSQTTSLSAAFSTTFPTTPLSNPALSSPSPPLSMASSRR